MNNKSYYQIAKEGSLYTDHPGMKVLHKLATNATSILDLGCGEGTRLNYLVSNQTNVLGVDASQTGIKLAKSSFPDIQFRVTNLENLPIRNQSFDLVYSAFVLEHLKNPEKVLNEAIRVTALKGYLVLIASNFGAPNRISPPFKGSKLNKFITGFLQDILMIFLKKNQLNWQNVKPIDTKDKYEIDWDTTIEPYIGTLVSYLKSKGLKIERAESCWSEEFTMIKLYQKIFRFLGMIGLYPFWMWGPHLLIVAKNK